MQWRNIQIRHPGAGRDPVQKCYGRDFHIVRSLGVGRGIPACAGMTCKIGKTCKIALFCIVMSFANVTHAQTQFMGKQDSSQPVEIVADQFELVQDQHQAIFTGHVIAKQGDMTLTSDRMVAHYRAGPETKANLNTISHIDVDGNVVIVTKEETGKGERGVYDVDNKRITLNGNVVLTKDKNVLKGDALEYNLVTGHSTLKSGGPSVSADGKTTGGRVRAVFVPEGK